jgi:hypothetical protein
VTDSTLIRGWNGKIYNCRISQAVPSFPSVKGRLDARQSFGKCSRQGDRKWNVGVLSTEFPLSQSKTTLIEFSGRTTFRIPTEFYPVVPTGGVALFFKEALKGYILYMDFCPVASG